MHLPASLFSSLLPKLIITRVDQILEQQAKHEGPSLEVFTLCVATHFTFIYTLFFTYIWMQAWCEPKVVPTCILNIKRPWWVWLLGEFKQ